MSGHSGRLTQGLPGLEMTPGLQDTDVQRVLRFNLIMTVDIGLTLFLILTKASMESKGVPAMAKFKFNMAIIAITVPMKASHVLIYSFCSPGFQNLLNLEEEQLFTKIKLVLHIIPLDWNFYYYQL